MMRAPSFRYVPARTVAQAASVLRAEGPGAMLLAGGTDLVPNMKRRQQTPAVVVSLRRIPELRGIRVDSDGGLTIGAATTLSEIVADARIARERVGLWRAAFQVATPHLRNAGTIGGNVCLDTRCNYYDQGLEWRQSIDFCMKAPGPEGVARDKPIASRRENDGAAVCWVAPGSPRCMAVSSTDCAPALIALGASVSLQGADGARRLPLADLYHDDGMAYLRRRPDEVLTAVHLPPCDGWRTTYWKLRRRGSFDFPVLGVAAALRLAKDGTVEEARVVLGAVASRPVLAPETSMLLGRALDDAAIDDFASKASSHARPLDNTDFALSWRKRVAKAYLAGALRHLRGDDPASMGLLARRAIAMRPD